MKVTLDMESRRCMVVKEPGDPIMRESGWGRNCSSPSGSPESQLLHHIKKNLIAQGYDVIKKRMWKDGHLVDELQHYIRTRNKKVKGPHFCIWNSSYQIRDAGEEFNEAGRVSLRLETDIFD